MPAPRKYPLELRERSVRLVIEAMAEDSSLSMNAAVKRVGPRVGVVPDTLRGWVKQSNIDFWSPTWDDDNGCGNDQAARG